MFYQKEDKEGWNGPVKVIAHRGTSVFVMANGNIKKVADCKVQPCESEDEISESRDKHDDEGVNVLAHEDVVDMSSEHEVSR